VAAAVLVAGLVLVREPMEARRKEA